MCRKGLERLKRSTILTEIKTNSLVALVGGSGSGKSTLLRIIAGLEKPTEGRIWLAGQDSVSLSIQEREIGFVFQTALFAHMTVSENIGFGLTLPTSPPSSRDSCPTTLHLIQLEGFAKATLLNCLGTATTGCACSRSRDGTKGSPVR
jgi:ABC-type sulfate/molybdate transport systems ATPase subunit